MNSEASEHSQTALTADELAAIRERADADYIVAYSSGQLGRPVQSAWQAVRDAKRLLDAYAALEEQEDQLKTVLRRVWDEIVDSRWIEFDRHAPPDPDHMHCDLCGAKVTYHYHSPNERGGKTYLGSTCDHAPDCLVPQVETLLGIEPFVPSRLSAAE